MSTDLYMDIYLIL